MTRTPSRPLSGSGPAVGDPSHPRRLALALVALLALAVGPIAAAGTNAQEPEELYRRSFDTAPGQALRVEVPDADIVLRNGPAEYVSVVVWLSGRDRERGREAFEKMNFAGEADADGVRVHADAVRSPRWRLFGWGSWGLTVEITLPERYDLDVSTADGDIDAASHEGNVSLTTSDGDVVADALAGTVRIVTSDGDIVLRAGSGPSAELTTSDGDIHLGETTFDNLVARSSDGDIVAQRLGGPAELRTSDGDIVVRATAHAVDARTHDGDIRVRLLASVAATLHSGDGDITIEAPSDLRATVALRGEDVALQSTALDGTVRPHSAEGRIGGGGPEIEATSGDGSVLLRLGKES